MSAALPGRPTLGAASSDNAPGVRFVIFGAGAIGGVVGARLAQAGLDVVLIARGAHYDAIRDARSEDRGPGAALDALRST